jgi:hypothetical protein
MNDNYDYEEEREYVRELYWESKGLGKTYPEQPKTEYIRDTQCAKCRRWGSAEAVAKHNEKYPNCDTPEDDRT